MTAVFLLSPQAEAGSSLLSIFQLNMSELPAKSAQDFASRSYVDTEMSSWSCEGVDNLETASTFFEQQAKKLAEHEILASYMEKYFRQLSSLTSRAQPFNSQYSDTVFQEEIDLIGRLSYSPTSPSVAYSLRPNVDENGFLKEFQHFMRQVSYILKPTLTIESKQDGSLFAQTLTRNSGKFETIWQYRISSSQKKLHYQTVATILETRQAILGFMRHIFSGALALTIRFSVAPALALPAALRFAHDVIRHAREDQLIARLQQLSSS